MHVVKFIERLELEQNISFMDRHQLAVSTEESNYGF